MKKLLYLTGFLLALATSAPAQKNFCHLLFELSSTDADSPDPFKAFIEQPCEFCPFYLNTDMRSKYEGVNECEFDFGKGRTYPEAPGKKFNVATATITLATYDDKTSKEDVQQMFDRAVKYLHESCFSTQQISEVFTDDKTKIDPTRIVYLYAAGFTVPVANDGKEYYYYFLERPHMDVRLQPDPLRPLTNLQVVLVWVTEAK